MARSGSCPVPGVAEHASRATVPGNLTYMRPMPEHAVVARTPEYPRLGLSGGTGNAHDGKWTRLDECGHARRVPVQSKLALNR
jgi:hypothetical protein